MSLKVTLSTSACKRAYKAFGKALTKEIIENLKQARGVEKRENIPQGMIDILEKSLTTLLNKVEKKEKKVKVKKDIGIHKRFRYEGNDIKGKNKAFLRIRIDRETRIVSKINEPNWTDQANLFYSKTFGMSTAYIIPALAGKKSQIVATQPYKPDNVKDTDTKKKKKRKKKKKKKRSKSPQIIDYSSSQDSQSIMLC